MTKLTILQRFKYDFEVNAVLQQGVYEDGGLELPVFRTSQMTPNAARTISPTRISHMKIILQPGPLCSSHSVSPITPSSVRTSAALTQIICS
jgi:hypothetical protein